MQSVKVRVWSDLACPYCRIGYTRLNAAIGLMKVKQPDLKVEQEWRAFLLDPNFNPQGEDLLTSLEAKFGPRSPQLLERVRAMAAESGAPFKDWRWRSNTLRGHCLVALARQQGRDAEAVGALFKKIYDEGANISGPEAVLEVARSLGLEGAEERLGGEELDPGLLREVQADVDTAHRELGITGVPFFIIGLEGGGQAYGVSGAQDPETLVEVIAKAAAEGSG